MSSRIVKVVEEVTVTIEKSQFDALKELLSNMSPNDIKNFTQRFEEIARLWNELWGREEMEARCDG